MWNSLNGPLTKKTINCGLRTLEILQISLMRREKEHAKRAAHPCSGWKHHASSPLNYSAVFTSPKILFRAQEPCARG